MLLLRLSVFEVIPNAFGFLFFLSFTSFCSTMAKLIPFFRNIIPKSMLIQFGFSHSSTERQAPISKLLDFILSLSSFLSLFLLQCGCFISDLKHTYIQIKCTNVVVKKPNWIRRLYLDIIIFNVLYGVF